MTTTSETTSTTGASPRAITESMAAFMAQRAGLKYVFFGGKRVARREASGAVHYYFSDHLGSSNVVTNATDD